MQFTIEDNILWITIKKKGFSIFLLFMSYYFQWPIIPCRYNNNWKQGKKKVIEVFFFILSYILARDVKD